MKYEPSPPPPKAKLLQELDSSVASVKSASIHVKIIDAMFFLHLLVDPPSKFGSVARYIFVASVQQLVVRSILFLIKEYTRQLKIVKERLNHLIDQIPTALLNPLKNDLATS